jgi:hypothetical protein
MQEVEKSQGTKHVNKKFALHLRKKYYTMSLLGVEKYEEKRGGKIHFTHNMSL